MSLNSILGTAWTNKLRPTYTRPCCESSQTPPISALLAFSEYKERVANSESFDRLIHLYGKVLSIYLVADLPLLTTNASVLNIHWTVV